MRKSHPEAAARTGLATIACCLPMGFAAPRSRKCPIGRRMGRLRPEFGEGVRSFTVENYVIYYRHERDVLVPRVLHGRRDQIAAWSEPEVG
jgi:hypothetical protein